MARRVVFKHKDKIIGYSEDTDLNAIERMKDVIAFENEIPYPNEVDAEIEDVPVNEDYGDYVVSPRGLHHNTDLDTPVTKIRCLMNLDRALDRFLDRVKDGTVHEVLLITQ